MTTAIWQTNNQPKESIPGEKTQRCQRCKNQYILIWLIQGMDYNDFGLRHCPFCGLLTDELTGSVMV